MQRILIVDDHAHIVRVMANALKRAGYDVTCASNGAQAFELFSEQPFDMLISDMEMPLLNGRQLVEQIHEQSWAPFVLLISGRIDSQLTQWAESVERVEFHMKPVSLSRLTELVQQRFAGTP